MRQLAPDLPQQLELVTREKSVGFLILIFNAFKLDAECPQPIAFVQHHLDSLRIASIIWPKCFTLPINPA